MAQVLTLESALRYKFANEEQYLLNVHILRAKQATTDEQCKQELGLAYLAMPHFAPEHITRMFDLRAWYVAWLTAQAQ